LLPLNYRMPPLKAFTHNGTTKDLRRLRENKLSAKIIKDDSWNYSSDRKKDDFKELQMLLSICYFFIQIR
jgi:hypothetical protein